MVCQRVAAEAATTLLTVLVHVHLRVRRMGARLSSGLKTDEVIR